MTLRTLLLTGATLMCIANPGLTEGTEPWPPLPPSEMALRGCEHCGRFVEDNPGWACHMPTLFITRKNPDVAWHTPQQHIEWALDPLHSYVADGTGALTVIAHPGQWQDEALATLKGLTGLEICHGGDFSKVHKGRWDRVLRRRLAAGLGPIWGFAADDTHSSTKGDRSWLAARLETLNERTLKTALRNGNFYVSTGPVITDVQVSGATITVRVGQKSDIRWLKAGQWAEPMQARRTYGVEEGIVSRESGKNHCLHLHKDVTESSYTLNDADGTTDPAKGMFIRCVVTADERAAMTQPFLIRSATSLDNPYASTGKWRKGMTHNHTDALPGDSTDKIKQYCADYAAKGHACAFETGYDYWVVPFQVWPPNRTPAIDWVEPSRLPPGNPVKVTVHGRAFAEGAKLLIDGRELAGIERVGPEQIAFTSPASLGAGRHDLTVRNPDGFQDTLQYALVVYELACSNNGWTQFTPHNSKVGSRYTYAMLDDGAGGVWLATNNGLNHFDGKQWRLYRPDDSGLAAETIYDLQLDEGRNLWFTCFRAVGMMAPDGKLTQWRSMDPEGARRYRFPGKQINQILRVGGVTYVTIFNRGGLYAFRDGKWGPVNINLPGVGKGVLHGLAVGSDGRIAMGSPYGVIVWDPAKGDAGWSRYHMGNSDLPEDYVLRVAFDGKGRLWAATATRQDDQVGGLCCLDGGRWKTYSPKNSPLPERHVWSVFIDRDGNAWAATSKGAACLKTDGAWRVFNSVNSGLSDDMVIDICQDRQGNMWFATANGVSRLAAEALPDALKAD